MAGIEDPVTAYDFDLTVMHRGLLYEKEQYEKARGKQSADPSASLARLKARMDSGEVEMDAS